MAKHLRSPFSVKFVFSFTHVLEEFGALRTIRFVFYKDISKINISVKIMELLSSNTCHKFYRLLSAIKVN